MSQHLLSISDLNSGEELSLTSSSKIQQGRESHLKQRLSGYLPMSLISRPRVHRLAKAKV